MDFRFDGQKKLCTMSKTDWHPKIAQHHARQSFVFGDEDLTYNIFKGILTIPQGVVILFVFTNKQIIMPSTARKLDGGEESRRWSSRIRVDCTISMGGCTS
ncbi:hypothetical protein P8452_32722 [Trifolium repens]|nr:hypothetical protein P8452_32722 [Trifolium repens]